MNRHRSRSPQVNVLPIVDVLLVYFVLVLVSSSLRHNSQPRNLELPVTDEDMGAVGMDSGLRARCAEGGARVEQNQAWVNPSEFDFQSLAPTDYTYLECDSKDSIQDVLSAMQDLQGVGAPPVVLRIRYVRNAPTSP
jgi:biopolymer transport protein ExbD